MRFHGPGKLDLGHSQESRTWPVPPRRAAWEEWYTASLVGPQFHPKGQPRLGEWKSVPSGVTDSAKTPGADRPTAPRFRPSDSTGRNHPISA